MTNFVGRRQEVGQVKRLLSTARLVTLTGVGGAGKTRLALRVATEIRRGYADGVWLVDLAPLTEQRLVEFAVAEALGAYDAGATTVVDFVRDRELLLVLDNCEHVLDACARLIDTMLRSAPGLRVLCTSRQPLGTICEHVWPVPPLPVPEPHALTGTAWSAYPSMVLFAERAGAVAPGFAVTADNQERVAEVCRRLDGLPLAIELAAAQLRTITVDQLEARLEDRLPMLSSRHATPAHHRTLATAFDWSFELASPAERELWRGLSVFADGFDLDAAEYVCAGATPLLDAVSGLVDKSVLWRVESADRVRYRLPETIRQYGLNRLRAVDGDGTAEQALRGRHRDRYLAVAEQFGADWSGPNQEELIARVRRDRSNIRAALAFCLDGGDAGGAQRFAASLAYYWLSSGSAQEGRYWLDRAIAAGGGPTATRARALAAYARVLSELGEPVGARSFALRCLATAAQLGDRSLVAVGMAELGISQVQSGLDMSVAQGWLEEALGLLGRDQPAMTIMAQVFLAAAVLYRGDADRAAVLCAEAVGFCRAHGSKWLLAKALAVAGSIELSRDDPVAALRAVREALGLMRIFGDVIGAARVLDLCAIAVAALGEYERAARLFGAAHHIWAASSNGEIGSGPFLAGRERAWRLARAPLGVAAFDAAYLAGGELSFDQAIGYALGEDDRDVPAPVPPGPPSDALSGRQRQVAELVADGMSNKQIATRLVIAQRTAESHVENILRKLQFTSRAQIATWHAERLRSDVG